MASFDATVGGSAANSFVDEAGAADLLPMYASASRVQTWGGLTSAVKQSLLMRATQMLETYIEWQGRRTNEPIQRLSWPRDFVLNPDGWDYFPADQIPERIKSACALLALNLAEGFDQSTSAAAPLNFFAVGSLKMSFAEEKSARGTSLIPMEVLEHLRGYGDYVGATGVAHTVRIERA